MKRKSKTELSAAPATTAPPAESPAPERPSAATIPQLRAALPAVDADFILTTLEAGWTIDEAVTEWMAELNRRNTRLQEQLATLTQPKK